MGLCAGDWVTITHGFGAASAAPRVASASGARWAKLVHSGGFMMASGLVAAVSVPLVLEWGTISIQSMAQIVGAFVAGVFVLQRMLRHMGTTSVAYVFLALTATYGAAAALRYGVSGVLPADALLASYVVAVGWCGGLSLLARHNTLPTFAVVPMDRAVDLREINGVRWSMLDTPDLSRHQVDGVVVDLHGDLAPEWRAFLARAALSGVPVYHVTQVQEAATGRTQIEHLSENIIGSLVPSGSYGQAKVVVDSLTALIALVVLGPLLLLVALAIRLDSPGPALFKQKRTGYRGDVFTIYKFRTMFQEGTPGRSFTAENDPRITRIGPFLRRTRLDELPQILNILRGEMSWIGPRPMAIDLTNWYQSEIPFFEYRHVVRPGITGWAQVQQGYADEIEGATKKLYYDFYYIKNFSFWLDLVITVKTVSTLVSGDGAR